MTIETTIRGGRWRSALPSADRWAVRIHREACVRAPALNGSVALLLADDAALQALNRRFRGRAAPTNVLSFPSGASAPDFLGDIAVSYETCDREAREKGASFADHAAHLVVHGLLHLAGFDHENDRDALAMEALEAEILGALGVADPYAGVEI